MAKKTSPQVSLNLQTITVLVQQVTDTISRHATVIVMVAAVSVLIYSIATVSMIITLQDDTNYRQEQSQNRVNGTFDKVTIEKVNNLKASSDSANIELPNGRRNPFIN
ncbi:hypothetical protein H7Y40_00890 [Pedobacter sp.]|nr:hypothetical protein [Candidatus Saccharibacteria bacterium]